MHGEAGGELIDEEQEEIRKLAKNLPIRQSRVIRRGFSHYRVGNDGRRRMRSASPGWRQMGLALEPWVHAYKLNGEEWDGPIAANTKLSKTDRIRARVVFTALLSIFAIFFHD
jgi:hypothetical protein